MKQVDAFIITSTRAPGKTRKAWYQYILVCNGHTVQKKEQVLDTTGHRMVLEMCHSSSETHESACHDHYTYRLSLLCGRPEKTCCLER